MPNQHGPAAFVEIALGERERFLDPKPGTPEHNDERPQPPAVPVLAGVHDALERHTRVADHNTTVTLAARQREPPAEDEPSTARSPPFRALLTYLWVGEV